MDMDPQEKMNFEQLLAGIEAFRAPVEINPAEHTRVRLVVTNDGTLAAYCGLTGQAHLVSTTAETAFAFIDLVWQRPKVQSVRTAELGEILSQSLANLPPVSFSIENLLVHVEDASFLMVVRPSVSQARLLAGEGEGRVTDVTAIRRR